jgi:hypothetical protein
MERRFDRTAEDLGNIVALEHVNVTVPDQQQATIFYMRQPLFMRPLVNRNPSQNNISYAPGYDAWIPGMAQE